MSAFSIFAQEHLLHIESTLDSYTMFMPEDCPVQLKDAMRYSLLGGGKRIRPLLTLMSCDACGGMTERAMPAACAVEMIHCYSLIHDDLPAMDDDDLRRGKPTNHKVYGEGQAIVAGDALLTYAFEILASKLPSEMVAESIHILAKAAGFSGMLGGQSDDLKAEKNGGDLHVLESIHHRKTAALISASLLLGAIVGEATVQHRTALARYGEHIGLLFQITDDLLDFTGTSEKTGKKVKKDAGKKKLTFPSLLGEEESRLRAKSLAEQAKAALVPLGNRAGHLMDLVDVMLNRDR